MMPFDLFTEITNVRPLISGVALIAASISLSIGYVDAQVPRDPQQPLAQDGQPPTALGFLKTDEDYVIRFSDGNDIFKAARSETTQATTTDSDGQTKPAGPVAWNYTLSLKVFHVVRTGGGSWVLLRHPDDPDDYMRWARQRQAMAILGSDGAKKLGSGPDGQERLQRLKQDAAQDISTTETWINLNHAIAIAPVPTEESKAQLSITSIKVDSKK